MSTPSKRMDLLIVFSLIQLNFFFFTMCIYYFFNKRCYIIIKLTSLDRKTLSLGQQHDVSCVLSGHSPQHQQPWFSVPHPCWVYSTALMASAWSYPLIHFLSSLLPLISEVIWEDWWGLDTGALKLKLIKVICINLHNS